MPDRFALFLGGLIDPLIGTPRGPFLVVIAADGGFDFVDCRNRFPVSLQEPIVTRAEDLARQVFDASDQRADGAHEISRNW